MVGGVPQIVLEWECSPDRPRLRKFQLFSTVSGERRGIKLITNGQ